MSDKKHIHYDKIIEWAADPTYPWQYKGTGFVASGKWFKCNGEPGWSPDVEYRRKPRWFDMEQEWIAKGRPARQILRADGTWANLSDGNEYWEEIYTFRLKPTPRPDADVLRAFAEDGSLKVKATFYNDGTQRFELDNTK